MNLDALKNIDINSLKNLDFNQLKSRILSRVDILINIFLIGITIFATIYIYNNKKENYNKTKAELEGLKEKSAAIKAFRAQEEKLGELKAELPESLDADLLVSKISEFAILHRVQIKTFSPAQETSGRFFTIAQVKINISSNDFKSLLAFTNEIENSKYFLRIKSWSAQMDTPASSSRSRSRSRYAEEEDPSQPKTIEAVLEIESVSLK